ncbi:MAG TPA: M23 family metallopeptidase, partial [Mycobacterium sp.]|nr:M23 family metallopeptidase [Mycobacterium sp.]
RLPIDRDRLAVGSGYGRRAAAFHPGVDFAAEPGTPIHAVGSGTVSCVRDLDDSGLRSVTVSRGALDTVYVFRPGDGLRIAVNDQVAAGARIGALGPDDESRDGFLHFEVRVDGEHTSPVRYLANMGLQPWPPAGLPRPVSGTFPPSSPCTITG